MAKISLREWCNQCEALGIDGVPCHEHGCPNEKKTRELIDKGLSTERYEWVRYNTCRECGCEVREGEECECQTPPR
jgi:hypothetical protein